MTQEELDALMAGGLEDDLGDTKDASQEVADVKEETDEVAEVAEAMSAKADEPQANSSKHGENYRVSADGVWPPPPPTEDHKMVHQLDDVTRDSEEKATQMFDKLETINNFFMDAESDSNSLKDAINSNVELFTTLSDKFPNIAAFSEALEKNNSLLGTIDNIISNLQMGQDEIMMAMDMMQYQDIHRQKIERVINVMRALSKYMNTLFEGRIDDDKRVGSAVHIAGDTTTENLVSNDDIEALIESLGKK
ncbi:chemotaxis protein [Campylobacter concisus]|uniref:Chemotaxis protein n=1 Tax=Campylobacter concisus TaxID=199 RepID=A0A7S9SAI9_9BACT|nr:chemotaxis protein [Campylobacter concisus]QPI06594.1 chemotaxis protein [Campylobacter concisus]